ncbi:MAG: DUF4861 domain-containing protein [Prevotella sp.]|nr:DUF4861 domain-containing protein [Prevotella sp.]
MKHLLTIMALAGMAVTAAAEDTTLNVAVTNTYSKIRKAVPVVVTLDDNYAGAVVTMQGATEELPYQIDDLNDDGISDELVFLTDMDRNEKQYFTIKLMKDKPAKTYENRTYGYLGIRDRSEKNQKHQRITSVTFPKETNPYNYIYPHGAVMENDMVGFRVYADHRQSLDYYGHRNHKMDIAETAFYTTQEQRDKGYGEDVLYTGSTYGCGALHGWDGQKSVMFENVRNRTQTVVTEGPIRTVLDITNKAWQPYEGCKPVDIRTRYILYYGHRDVEVQVKFSRSVEDISLSTGIVDIVEGSTEFTDKAGLRGDWGRACAGNNPKVYDTITVGLGIYVPKEYYKSDSHFTDGKDHLPNQAYVEVVGTKTDEMHYWFTATCDIETFGFKDKEAWFSYLKGWKKEMEKPAKVELKN